MIAILKSIATLVFCMCFIAGYSTNFTATTTGKWSSSTTWGGAGVPNSTSDNVTIPSGITVYLGDYAYTCGNITIAGILDVANNSSSGAGWPYQLTATNVFVDNGGTIMGTNDYQITILSFTNLAIGATGGTNAVSFLKTTDNGLQITISGLLTIGNSSGTGTGTFNYSPNLTGANNPNSISINAVRLYSNATYTLNCSGSSCPTAPSNNLVGEIRNTGGVYISNTAYFGGSYLTNTSGNVINSGTIILTGDFTNTSGSFTNVENSNAAFTINGNLTNNATINNNCGATVTVGGTFSQGASGVVHNTTATLPAGKFSKFAVTTTGTNSGTFGTADDYMIYSGGTITGTVGTNVLNNSSLSPSCTPSLIPPTLTAASGATVDNSFTVTFVNDATWFGTGGTVVKYGSNTLVEGTDYTLAEGVLTINPSGSAGSGLRTAGTQTISISKTGYMNATVSQTIGAGAATKLAIKTALAAPASNGVVLATQPAIYIQDQYGNTVSSNATVTAAVASGVWTLGGTASLAANSGTATFTNLTATSDVAVTNATIIFSCGSLTTVTSGTFNIPAPVIYYSITTGDWTSTNTWSSSCGGATGIGVPPTGARVQICQGTTVTIPEGTSPTISELKVIGAGAILNLANNIWQETITVTGNTYIDEGGLIKGSTGLQNYSFVFNNLYIGTRTSSSATSSLVMDQENKVCNITISGLLVLGNCDGKGTAVFNYSPKLNEGTSTLTITNRLVRENGTYTYGCTSSGGTCPSAPTTVTPSDCPAINVSETTRTGFSYCSGNGPSAYQSYTVSGSGLSDGIVITAPTNYEISTLSGSGYAGSLTLNHSSGTVPTTTIYVRLKSGLAANTYNNQVISHTSSGITKNVTCSGSVVSGTSISVSSATISGFSACVNSASSSQSYTVSGQCLSEDLTITPPTDYQISVDNFNWVTNPTAITLSPSYGNVGVTTIYVRLRPGLTANSYNNQIITHTGGGATQQNITCSGSIYAYPTANAGADMYVCNSPFYQVNATSVAYSPYVGSGSYVSGGSDDIQSGAIDRSNVVNPAPEAVYQTGRKDAHTYTFTGLTSGTIYLIRLHFSEHWAEPGQRQFNVAINGVSKLTNFDINVAAGGKNKAVVKEFYVAADGSGQIIVSFTNGAANSALSRGVELYSTGQLTATGGGTYLWNTGVTTQSIYVGAIEAAYTVTVTANGCSSQDAVQVAVGCGDPAPFLTAAPNATVDAPFDATFTDNATWRSKITSVTVDGTVLTAAGYTITSGKITFTPSTSNPTGLLQTSGTKRIVVQATGYTPTAVNQIINPGAAAILEMKTQPIDPSANGAVLATQPQVYLKDKYSNLTTSNAVVTATVGAGSWTIGGTVTKTASLGTATFVNLTASAGGAVTGAKITFTSPGLTSVTSTAFNIPGLPSIAITSANPSIAAGNIEKKSTKQIISACTLTVANVSTQLQSLTFTTAGTYSASDVVNFKLWYNSSNDITKATRLGGEITSGLGTGSHTFTNLSHAIASGVTEYMWITVDIAENANYGKTINTAAIIADNFTFASGTKSVSISAGGTKTIVLTTALSGFNYIGTGPSKYQTFNLANTGLSPASGTITVTAPTHYEISKSANSGYGASLTYSYNSSTLSANNGIVYVRLKAGLTAGTDYNNENITFTGDGGYNALTVKCSGGVGQIYYFKQNGNWTNPNTWSLSCGGATASSYPTYKDSAVCTCTGMGYDNNYLLTVDADVTVGAIYIDRKLDISSDNVTLTIKNSLQTGRTDTWSEGQGSINVGNGTLIVEGDLILGYNNDGNGLKWNNGNVYVGGNLICSDGGGPSPLAPGDNAAENVSLRPGGGPMAISGGLPVPTYAGSIIMTGENKSIVVNAAAVDLVRIKLESSTITKTGNGTLYITENTDFNGQTAFENLTGSFIISGSLTNAENATLINDAIVKIATSNNNVAVHSGTDGSTTEYNSVGDEPVNNGTYYNLTISGGGTKSLQGDIVINNNLTFSSAGYLSLNGNDITINNWVDGHITPLTTTDRYIIDAPGNGGVFTINDVSKNETANFPIGLSASDADFCRVDITNTGANNTSFAIDGVANGLYTTYSNSTSINGATGKITANAVDYTWFITSASTSANVTFYWDKGKELLGFDEANCAAFHYGSLWERRGNIGAATQFSGTIYSKTGSFNGFSPGSIQISYGALPIELLSFTAKKETRNGVILHWVTASELNNDYFSLERSTNGYSWEEIYTCKGAGTSTIKHNYSFIDIEPQSDIVVYYRLKQIDIQGNFTYSDIQSVSYKYLEPEILAYPNPFDGKILYLKGLKDDFYDISIINPSGLIVYSTSVKIDGAKVIVVDIDKQLKSGSYIFNCKSNHENISRLLIVK